MSLYYFITMPENPLTRDVYNSKDDSLPRNSVYLPHETSLFRHLASRNLWNERAEGPFVRSWTRPRRIGHNALAQTASLKAN